MALRVTRKEESFDRLEIVFWPLWIEWNPYRRKIKYDDFIEVSHLHGGYTKDAESVSSQ